MSHPYKDPRVQLALNDIQDTFSGGANDYFLAFLMLIRDMDQQAAKGDESAKKILKIMLDFHRLIQVSKSHMTK